MVEDLSLLKGFHFSTLSSIKERKKILNSTDKLFPSSNEMGRQNNNSYNFTIDTTTVQTLVAQNYISYTFIAQMNQPDSTSLQNYVLTFFNNDSIHEMLVVYPKLNPTAYAYDMHNISANPIDGNLSILGRSTICNGYNVDSWVETCIEYDCSHFGGDGTHGAGQACDDGNIYALEVCQGAWVTTCIENTEEPDPIPNSTGGGGGGSGNPDAIAIIPLDECNSNFGETGPNGECFLIDEDDCKEIKEKISDIPLIKTRLKELRDSESPFEQGFKANKIINGNYAPGTIITSNSTNQVNVRPNSQTVVIAHRHTDNVAYKMFSAPDILKMAEMAKKVLNSGNSSVKLTELTHIVVFKNINGNYKTFALRFDNVTSVQNLINILNNPVENLKFKKKLKLDYGNDNSGRPLYENTTTLDKQQRHIFNLLDNYNLNMSLYEANFDNDGFVNGWQKINKNTLDKEPCN